LTFKEFERVEAKFWLGDFERFFEDGGGFVLHEEEVAVSFVFADFLHNAKVVDRGVEVAPGEDGYGFEGNVRVG
jgi:hypothetical protein